MYRPGAQNRADALTRREWETDEQTSVKAVTRKQTLLQPDQLDSRIRQELTDNSLAVTDSLDLIDHLLQANRNSEELADRRLDEVTRPAGESPWAMQNGLVLYNGRLVVPNEDNLRTQIIKEAHAQVSTAHPGRNKTRKIIADRYYWPKMHQDID